MNSLPLRTRLCSHAPLKTAKIRIKTETSKFQCKKKYKKRKKSPASMLLTGDKSVVDTHYFDLVTSPSFHQRWQERFW